MKAFEESGSYMPCRRSSSDVQHRDPATHTPQKRNTWHAAVYTEAEKLGAADISGGHDVQEPATCRSSLVTPGSVVQSDIASASDPPDKRHSAERDKVGTTLTEIISDSPQQSR